MIDLDPFRNLVPLDHGLSVVVTRRPDHTPHTSVVNAGVLHSPLDNTESVAFVAAGRTRKLTNLRSDPTISIVARVGWRWATVEGTATLIGPDDPDPGINSEQLRLLLRDIFTAAGGTHDNWDTYDQTMRDEHRTAVLITPSRTYTSPT